jgi:hypothetical protein
MDQLQRQVAVSDQHRLLNPTTPTEVQLSKLDVEVKKVLEQYGKP